MAATPFEIVDGTLFVRSDPQYNDPEFQAACQALVASPMSRLVIDLSAVRFISSREVGVLVGAAKKARETGKDLVLKVSRSVEGIIKILRLDTFLHIETGTTSGTHAAVSKSPGAAPEAPVP